MKKTLLVFATTALQLSSGNAFAVDKLNLSAFATLGVVTSSARDLQYQRVGIEAAGRRATSFSADSVVGMQGNYRLGKGQELVLQALTRKSPRNNYAPRATLAFFNQPLTPELTVRLGRTRMPTFMLSESIDINYAHPWVRPPEEVYALNPFPDLDGVDLLYRPRLNGIDLELHPYFGLSRVDIAKTGKARLTHLRGLSIGLSRGPLTVHLGHARARLRVRWGDSDFFRLKQFLQASPTGHQLLAEMEGNRATTSFTSAGFQWDGPSWLLIGEFASRRTDAYVNSVNGWHLTLGHHLGAVTPYLKLARMRQTRPIVPSRLSAGLSGIEIFNASRNGAQESIAGGMRWDFHPQAAAKMEIARTRISHDAWGSFFPTGDILNTRVGGRKLNTLSVSIDVVF